MRLPLNNFALMEIGDKDEYLLKASIIMFNDKSVIKRGMGICNV